MTTTAHRWMPMLAAVLAVALVAAGSPASAAGDGPVVFAAASMKTALDAIAAKFAAKTGHAPVISYGSSGVLAKQIAGGAPADLFISADEQWMSFLADKGELKAGTRETLLGNELVLVAPASADARLAIKPGFDLAGAVGDGKLAVCTVSSSPAGIYGKEALTKLGVYGALEPKLAQAENVRAALLLVARGEAAFGIVYATDARSEPKVKVVDTFPAATHAPITYPVAVTKDSKNAQAGELEAYLHGPEATEVLRGQGFTILKP